MFGSPNPFGQPSSPFASQSVFGQTAQASNNPFAPKPFGSTSPFGSQTGTSVFGGTSTGVFGAAQSSSPFSSTTAFGASSSPAFGSTLSTFGSSSTPAFGNSSSSSFGGSSVFGQKPLFGGFGSTPTQTNPFGSTNQQSQPAFGSTNQQSQPAFGSSVFGSSSPFGAPSQSAFGASSTPAFGATNTPGFGATSTPAFGTTSTPAFGAASTPAFGASSTPAFGATSTPAFGATSTPAFGATSTPAFGATSGSAFGATSTPAFGAASAPAFGATSNPAFGSTGGAFGSTGGAFGSTGGAFGSTPVFGSGGGFAASTSAFGASSTPSFSFGSTPAFGQSTSAFGSSTFGSTPSPFGAQSSPFGAQSTTTFGSTGFGQSAIGGQRGGSRITPYAPTTEPDSGTQPAGKLESISAMPTYKDKSHEELRWEDYQLGDKGGPLPAGQTAGSVGFGVSNAQPNLLATSTFSQSSANPFSTTTSPNPFAPKPSSFGNFGPSTFSFSSSAFAPTISPNPFASTPASTSSFLSTTSSPFGSSSLFSSSNTQALGTQPAFASTASPGTNLAFNSSLNFSNTQSSPLFQSTTPSIGQTGSAFGQTATPFTQSSLFSQPSSGVVGNLFSSSPSLIGSSNPMGFGQSSASYPTPFQPAQQLQTSTSLFSNLGQTQPNSAGFSGISSIFGQGNFGQPSMTQGLVGVQPVPATNPFGMLPAMPHMSINRAGAAPSVQYGISSMPVVDKTPPVRISSFLTPRHLSQRRVRLPARKYHPKNDGPKVPFFTDEEMPSTPKADALFIPRENPRALVIRPTDQWTSRTSLDKPSPLKDTTAHENGKISENSSLDANNFKNTVENTVENGTVKDSVQPDKVNQKPNGIHEDHSASKDELYRTFGGHRAGEAAIVYEHGADIEALMPKLRHADYYTEPKIQELAAKERAEPGFCRHVKDFVVGRHGYGSIKFFGETDVRRLDLESIVQFNNREVIVYLDESKKPPRGQGLNKPAEVTILNIKCFDKKTGHQYTEGPKVEKYKEMLRKKTEAQGAEFVSYEPVKGEWKFRVEHFSKYNMENDDNIEELEGSFLES